MDPIFDKLRSDLRGRVNPHDWQFASGSAEAAPGPIPGKVRAVNPRHIEIFSGKFKLPEKPTEWAQPEYMVFVTRTTSLNAPYACSIKLVPVNPFLATPGTAERMGLKIASDLPSEEAAALFKDLAFKQGLVVDRNHVDMYRDTWRANARRFVDSLKDEGFQGQIARGAGFLWLESKGGSHRVILTIKSEKCESGVVIGVYNEHLGMRKWKVFDRLDIDPKDAAAIFQRLSDQKKS